MNRGIVTGHARTVVIFFATALCSANSMWSPARAGNVPKNPTAGNTKVVLFNLAPATSYSIDKNSEPFSTANSSQAGIAVYVDFVASGDRYEVAASGGGPQPPAAPTGVSAAGDDAGCASIQWHANAEPDVDFYRLYRGLSPGLYNDSLDVVGATGETICGLADGTYYFSLRAHNTAGLLSALSPEVTASVSNGSTQPPLPPAVVDAAAGNAGCVEVSWVPSGSPAVTGYVVDYGTRSVAGGQASTYDHTVDVGNTTAHSVCGLASGTYYVAVRSKNSAGMLSVYSSEDTVVVVPTAVFITAFSGTAGADGVELLWEIWTDEQVRGYKIYRSRKSDEASTVLNGGRAIDPSLTSWLDSDVEPATAYSYTLVVIGEDGVEHRSRAEQVTTLALSMLLEQNAPNPFNPVTSISFVVPATSRTVLAVYDVTGALVRTLVDDTVATGRWTVQWHGTDNRGQPVGSGTYFYRLTVGKRSASRKMLLLK
jgi:hypothetical protein